MSDDFIRPRLVLLSTLLADGKSGREALARALAGGDVASVILDPAGRGEAAFQSFAEDLVPLIQEAGAAAIVADDTRCAGRIKADGLHVSNGALTELGEAMARFSPRLIVGASGFNTRHDALEAGERLPDYLFFGKLGADTQAAPFGRNLDMAEWWSEVVEIPCIVLGGADIETLPEAIATRADFVALSAAVFADPAAAGERVAAANALFDEAARVEAA